MALVTVTARRLLADAVRNSGRRSTVQLPEEFARTPSPDDPAPALIDLFQRGEVPLKLYLTLLMLTRKGPPHELYKARPDYYWAEMLGYEELDEADPVLGSGTRRVKRAMMSLHAAGYIVRTPRPGYPPHLEVRHPTEPARAPYITLPLELWSGGWINVLSARALVAYICLRLMLPGEPDDVGVHISRWDRGRLHVKDDTWQRAVKELESHNVVRTERRRVAADRWTSDLTLRKMYYLNNDHLMSNEVQPSALSHAEQGK